MSGPVLDGYHWLYRVFDAEGQLLYIGRTHNPWQRMSHQLCTAWRWSKAADHIDWEPIGRYEDACAAEVAAITSEAPLHNLQHNKANRQMHVAAGTLEYERRRNYRRSDFPALQAQDGAA